MLSLSHLAKTKIRKRNVRTLARFRDSAPCLVKALMFRSSDYLDPPAHPMPMPASDRDHRLAEAFRDFISSPEFPCVGAKSAVKKGDLTIVVARRITSNWDDQRIHSAMLGFIARYRNRPDLFQSFAVIFANDEQLDERRFEDALWDRMRSLVAKDAAGLRHPWDARVSSDPQDPHFSMSVAGEAFFVVGLHPGASRPARRFKRATLVFNLHDQFERLRQDGRYEKLRDAIIERDIDLAGTPNPMLARHGEISEARQYSGRVVDGDWRCPFAEHVINKDGG